MYQAADRHCTKVAEMLSWRSQRSRPTIDEEGALFEPLDSQYASSTPSPLAPCGEDDEKWYPSSEQEDTNEVYHSPTRQRAQRPHADSGISLGRYAEAMNILSIHPLSEVPDVPNEAFIISTSVSSGPARGRGAIYGELQPVMIPKRRSELQTKIDEDDLSSEPNSEYGLLENNEKVLYASPPSPCRQSGQSHSEEGQDEQGVLDTRKYRARDIHLLIERDAAIESVDSQHAPHQPHQRPDPEATRRFEGLLGRLCRETETLKESPNGKNTLNDPAIVSFAPQEDIQHSASRELAPELTLERCRFSPNRNHRHAPSDSGYASSSTRTQSRSRHGASDETGLEPVTIQNGKVGSKDPGSGRCPKSSTLNPAAKAFSSTNEHSASAKRNILESSVPNNTFLQPPLGQAQFGTGIHSQGYGYSALPNFDSPLANLSHLQPASLQVSPALLPQAVPFPLPALPHPPGLGFTPSLAAGIPGFGNIPSLPLRPSPSSLGLTRPPQPLGSVPMSGPIPSEFVGAFHQQLPTVPSCNNPAHQSDGSFSGAQSFLAPAMPQLAPPAPPASLFSPTHSASVPPPIAPAAPVVNPIFRKTVPKPKVPNTTGQQYWEYWHELRRTFEPGYAQKSKQNQQKRYLKQQIHKNGGTTDQD